MRMNFTEQELAVLAHCLQPWKVSYPPIPGTADLLKRVEGALAYVRKSPELCAAIEEELAADDDD